MAKRKNRKAKTSRFQFLKAFFTGNLPKPKRKAKKRVSVDASKGRKRIPKPSIDKPSMDPIYQKS